LPAKWSKENPTFGFASARARTFAVEDVGCATATEEIKGLQQIVQRRILKKVVIFGERLKGERVTVTGEGLTFNGEW
jgi:hypothetical protein